APFSGTPGAPGWAGGGNGTPAGGVASVATRMGTRIASLPAAFASAACSTPDSATCRVLGKVTSRAIGARNLTQRKRPGLARFVRRARCAAGGAGGRKQAADCRFGKRHPDSKADGHGWSRTLSAGDG